MALDDEKKEKEKIRKKIKEKEKKRNKYKEEKKKLENKTDKLKEEKEKFEKLRDKCATAVDYLNNAKTNLNSAQSSYNQNWSGNAANKKKSTFTNSISSIGTITKTLLNAKTEAVTQIKKLQTEISDNTRIIGDYNNKIHNYEKDIQHLRHKL